MPTTLRASATLQTDTNLPKDWCVNTWHFRSLGVDPVDDANGVVAALDTFYTSVQAIFSTALNGTVDVKIYDLSDVPPRVPILQQDFVITPDTSPRLPNECAIAMSYRAALTSGQNPARRRGRLFLGPLSSDVVTAGVGDASVTPTARNLIADAANALLVSSLGEDWHWCVFSPTTAGPEPWSGIELTASSLAVVGGYIDDAFDTIRSRGASATERTTFNDVG